MHTERGDGIAGRKRRRRDLSSDGVMDLMMASGRLLVRRRCGLYTGDYIMNTFTVVESLSTHREWGFGSEQGRQKRQIKQTCTRGAAVGEGRAASIEGSGWVVLWEVRLDDDWSRCVIVGVHSVEEWTVLEFTVRWWVTLRMMKERSVAYYGLQFSTLDIVRRLDDDAWVSADYRGGVSELVLWQVDICLCTGARLGVSNITDIGSLGTWMWGVNEGSGVVGWDKGCGGVHLYARHGLVMARSIG
ncbi:hypothetical protein Tco_0716682 [Tanacetum coccineum]